MTSKAMASKKLSIETSAAIPPSIALPASMIKRSDIKEMSISLAKEVVKCSVNNDKEQIFSPTSPITSLEQKNSISPADFVFLLKNRFLETLVIDLQEAGLSSEGGSSSDNGLVYKRIKGSYSLPNLASQLKSSPNAGSAIYALTCNSTLRELISNNFCSFVLVYDFDGKSDGAASIFCSRFKEIFKVTGKRFGLVQWVFYLKGGIEEFQKLYPPICVEKSVILREEDKVVLESPFSAALPNEGDVVSSIYDNFLFLSGIDATSLEAIKHHQFDVIVSLGETPLLFKAQTIPDENIDYSEISHSNELPLSPSTPNTAIAKVSMRRQKLMEGVKRIICMKSDGKIVFNYYYPLEDSAHAPIELILGQTTEIIAEHKRKNHKILVHCFGGVSRSASVVIAYLVMSERKTLAEAFGHVFLKRPWVRPNEGFWKKLQDLEIEERVIKVMRTKLNVNRNSSAPPGLELAPIITSTAAITPIELRFYERSRLMKLLEDRSVSSNEGSMSHVAMKNTKLNRVYVWSGIMDALSCFDIPSFYKY